MAAAAFLWLLGLWLTELCDDAGAIVEERDGTGTIVEGSDGAEAIVDVDGAGSIVDVDGAGSILGRGREQAGLRSSYL